MEEMVLWSENYIGLADEYEIVYQGKVQEFIVPPKFATLFSHIVVMLFVARMTQSVASLVISLL